MTTRPNETAIRDAIDRLQALLDTPPATGYGDGYDVIQLTANFHDAVWDHTLDVDVPDGAIREDLVNPDDPFASCSLHADDWEQIVPTIEQHLDPQFIDGMTQAFIVIRR